MSKKVLIIDNILTPYIIARYNAINTVLKGELEVWFQAKTDINRHWKDFPPIKFSYSFLEDRPIRIIGTDVATFHVNLGVIDLLNRKQNQYKEVIICGWDSFTYWYTVFYCKLKHIPLTLWAGSTEYEKSWRRTVFMPIILLIVHSADAYFAYGTRAKKFLMQLGAQVSKIKIFINSVDIQYFVVQAKKYKNKKVALKKNFGIKNNDFVFLYNGQLIERKGILDLIEAFKKLHAVYGNTCLLIVGSGPLSESITPDGAIHVVGHVEYSELPKYYAIADALILPSHEEVWGLVVNESLASGVPVIVSHVVGAAADLVRQGKNGYIFEAGNVGQLLLSMKRMLTHAKTLCKMAQSSVLDTEPYIMARQVFR